MKKKSSSFNRCLSNICISINAYLLTVLRRFDFWLKRKKECDNPLKFDDLTPTADADEDGVYSQALKWALSNKNIKNIALTGVYGSGKSSVIKTFERRYPEYKVLNISLASFSEYPNCQDDKLNRLLELSIVQQIFYHVKHNQIPDSRFKRIKNLKRYHIGLFSMMGLLMLASLFLLFKPTFLTKTPLWDVFSKTLDEQVYPTVIALVILAVGFVYIVWMLRRVANNYRVNKLSIKNAEIEIDKEYDSSILNKHLDEILYFFEVTNFDLVVIEDIDRFDNTEIFTKLRELNLLINNSKQIDKRIVFLYAVRDDMFEADIQEACENEKDGKQKKDSRTKFFDFIIPIIPHINITNSGAILRGKFEKLKLIGTEAQNRPLTEKFLNDITLFIGDMRLLQNVFNEYMVYKEKLTKDKKNEENKSIDTEDYDKDKRSANLCQNKLLAMVLYKNIYPDDFALLHKGEGKICELFGKKNDIVKNKKIGINQEIDKLKQQITELDTHVLSDLKELRSVYVQALIEFLPKDHIVSIYVEDSYLSIKELLDEIVFNVLKNSQNNIKYQYSSVRSGLYSGTADFAFSHVEGKVNKKLSYNDRVQIIKEKNENETNSLKKHIEKLNCETDRLEHLSFSELLCEVDVDVDEALGSYANDKLLRYLLLNDYIDENYYYYISFFYEGYITVKDRDFISSIKTRIPQRFDLNLVRLANVLSLIDSSEFRYDSILNYSLADYLIDNKEESKYEDQYNAFIDKVSDSSKRSISFIDSFIERDKNIAVFIPDVAKRWNGIWEYMYFDSDYTDEKKEKRFLLLLKYISTAEDIVSLNMKNSLVNYIQEKDTFFEIVSEINDDKIISLILDLKVVFEELPILKSENAVFDYVCDNNLYALTADNIKSIIKSKDSTDSISYEAINESNYTTILGLEYKSLIDHVNGSLAKYVKDVMLELPENKKESEDSILLLLNTGEDVLSSGVKKDVIGKQSTIIHDVSMVTEYSLVLYLFTDDKVSPTWRNILYAYDVHIEFIEEAELNTLPSELPKYINNHATALSEQKLSEASLYTLELATGLSKGIILNDVITESTLGLLLPNLPKPYDDLDFDALSEGKVELMIKGGMLELSIKMYNYIAEHYPELTIDLVRMYPDDFMSNADNFGYNEEEFYKLMTDDVLSDEQKIQLVPLVSEELILGSTEISKEIVGLYGRGAKPIQTSLLKGLVSIRKIPLIERVGLLNVFIDNMEFENVVKCIENLGEPFSLLLKNRKPSVKNEPIYLEFLSKLKEREIVSSYKESGEEILMYSRSSHNFEEYLE